MSAALTTLFGALGAVAALLAVLLPVILTQGAHLRREIDAVRGELGTLRADVVGDLAAVRGDLGALRSDLHGLGERVARIEGALTGPWRPANGTPAATAAATAPPTPDAGT